MSKRVSYSGAVSDAVFVAADIALLAGVFIIVFDGKKKKRSKTAVTDQSGSISPDEGSNSGV